MAISDPNVRRLEEVGALTWPAESVEPLDGWSLSIDRGVTRRANSVLPYGSPEALRRNPPLADRISAVERRYRQAGLNPCFKMTRAAVPADLDDHLHRRGYRAEGHSIVLCAAVAAAEDRPSLAVDLAPDRTPEWVACSWPGGPKEVGVDDRCRIADRVGQPKVFAMVHLDGRPAGAAMASIARGWGCVTAVRTEPAFRRRGVARAMIAALAQWADGQGAGSLFLQVEEENQAALGLYGSAGYREAYRYHYRTLARRGAG